MEAGAQLEQPGDPSALADDAFRRPKDPRDHLEHGRLARAVMADQPERAALRHLERHIGQRPEVLGARPAAQHALLERGRFLAVQAEALGDVDDLDRGRAHSSSAKSPDIEKYSRQAMYTRTSSTS